MFWPKEWLPNEVGFEHVRLHSYGYHSDGTTRKQGFLTTGIHEIGKALIADIFNSPEFRKNGDVRVPFLPQAKVPRYLPNSLWAMLTRDGRLDAHCVCRPWHRWIGGEEGAADNLYPLGSRGDPFQ